MPTSELRPLAQARRGAFLWLGAAAAEAGLAGVATMSIAYGPFSFKGQSPMSWLAWAAGIVASYLWMNFWQISWLMRSVPTEDSRRRAALRLSMAPFGALFVLALIAAYIYPGTPNWTSFITKQPAPFPVLALGTSLLAALLLKTVALVLPLRQSRGLVQLAFGEVARVAVPAAFLLIGVLQASVYILPIGNATMRFWAIADGIPARIGYPVTLTEPGPVSAGSPPFVYDLPLFPILLWTAFSTFGHNSAAAHLPGFVSSALFPVSLYLLLKEATGSRRTATIFAALTSFFPFFRLWVLNLPDPDPFFLTSLCLAGYLYLRALAKPSAWLLWIGAGLIAGITSLARPEGVLYVACIGLAILAFRTGVRQLLLFSVVLGLFVVPMALTWMINFGFIWPQNYNGTLSLSHPLETFAVLAREGAPRLYYGGLGMSGEVALGLLLLFVGSALAGVAISAVRDRRLLALAIPAVGNTVMIFFTDPYISNAYQYADFFRHASFGIPFLAVMSAYGFQNSYRLFVARRRLQIAAYTSVLVLIAVVCREGDMLANPTFTHRYGSPFATQVVTDDIHLSLESILANPMELPQMSYHRDRAVIVAYPTGIRWPDDIFAHFKPFDITLTYIGTPFAYTSVLAFLIAIAFALIAESGLSKIKIDGHG